MKRFKNILLYVGSEQNEAAVSRAVKLAIENSAKLTFMDVVKPIPHALGLLSSTIEPDEIHRLVSQDHRERLLQMASEYLDTGVSIDVVVANGDPATEIVRQVLAEEHDLVIKTADGISSSVRLFGSIARSLLRICPCPLWLLKPEIHGSFDRVLAAIDLESTDPSHRDLNQKILELASSVAVQEGAQLHIVGGWELWMESSLRRRSGDAEVDALIDRHEKEVQQALSELRKLPGIDVPDAHIHLHRGNAARVVRSVADRIEADLMVLGTVCRTGAAGLLIGNTAETILADVTCSILAMKPVGFLSPVEMAAGQKSFD